LNVFLIVQRNGHVLKDNGYHSSVSYEDGIVKQEAHGPRRSPDIIMNKGPVALTWFSNPLGFLGFFVFF